MSTVQFPADSRQFLWKLSRPLKRSKLSRTRRRGIIQRLTGGLNLNILSFSDHHHCQGVVSNSLAGALRHNLVTRSTWGVTVSNLTAAFSPRSASHQLVTRVNRVIASSATISSSREFLLRGMFPELSAYLLSISCACFQMFTR